MRVSDLQCTQKAWQRNPQVGRFSGCCSADSQANEGENQLYNNLKISSVAEYCTHVLAFDPEFRHAVLRRHRELDSVLVLGDVDVGRDLAALERHRQRRRGHGGHGLLRAIRRQLQLAEDEEVPLVSL